MKKTTFACLLGIFAAGSLYAQPSIKNTFYLEPGYNIPAASFGYPVNYTGEYNSLNTYGAGVGAGVILYMSESETPKRINVGLDYTVAELVVNSNYIAYVGSDYDGQTYVSETSLTSRMISMKLGPVVTFVPQDRFAFDVFVQGQLGLSYMDFYNDKKSIIDHGSDMQVQYRVAGGIRIGYYKTFLKVEYNYGVPTIKKAADINAVTGKSLIDRHSIDQSYLRVALCIKFNSF